MSKDPISALLRQAKQLHQKAKTGSMCQALPILRRLLNVKVFQSTPLTQLYKSRETIQRKHLLRMLALEAGFNSWEQYKPALQNDPSLKPDDFHCGQNIATLNLWFSSESEAQTYVHEYGGEVKRYGSQAVVTSNQD